MFENRPHPTRRIGGFARRACARPACSMGDAPVRAGRLTCSGGAPISSQYGGVLELAEALLDGIKLRFHRDELFTLLLDDSWGRLR